LSICTLAAAPVPSPLWLITFLHGLTFVLHMVAMNILVASAFHLATSRGTLMTTRRRMAMTLPPAFSVTVTLGVAPLLFLQLIHGERFYASSIQMGWPWLLSLLVLMLAYHGAYAVDGRYRKDSEPPSWLRVVPLLGLFAFSFVLTSNVALSERPDVQATLGTPGWNFALAETGAVWRWAHDLAGAIALGSVWLFVLGAREADVQTGQQMRKRAAVVALGATVVAAGLGITQTLIGPSTPRGAVATGTLYVGIVLAVATAVSLWTAVQTVSFARVVIPVGLAVGTLVANTATRFATRADRLQSIADIPAVETATQVGPIVLFGVCLVVAVGVLAWLVSVALKAGPPRAQHDEGVV
jgi:hypothetical protein